MQRITGMCSVKLVTFLILLNSLQNVHPETTKAVTTESETKPSPTNDTSLSNTTSAKTDEITTIPTTQSKMTTGSTTPKSGANPTIPGKGNKIFVSGSNLSISCTYNSSSMLSNDDMQKLKFVDKDDVPFGASRKFTTAHTRNSATSVTVTLNKAVVDRSDAGRYQCKYDTGVGTAIYNDVIIVAFDTTPAEYNNTAGNKQDIVLKCKHTVEKESNVIIGKIETSWRREDKAASSVSDRHRDNGTMLFIEKTEWSDIGPYTCDVTLTWGGSKQTVSAVVPLNGAPKIGKMDSSKNVVQDDDLEIKCPVSGYPYPTVMWKKDGVLLVQSKRITFSILDGKYENAILNINNLEFEDKGEYTCNATSSEYQSGTTASISIRVKDKLAALWPFLGIVAEVIVLCIIIFIYEKKRSREMEDEADGGDDVVNADDHKGKDVRQRNVRT